MKRFLFFFLIAVLIATVGCSHRGEERANSEDSAVDEVQQMESEASVDEEAGAVESYNEAEMSDSESEQQDRMVIYQGEIEIEVTDYHEAANAIKEETGQRGGYVVESSFHEDDSGRVSGSLVIRVPQQYFHSFLEYVAESDGKVLHQSTSGNDVTEEFVDLESRLASKRIVEERLLGFMESANSTDNLLKISNDLAQVQEEIEQIVGRMNYIENQVDLSTLTIFIQERRVEITSFQDENSLNTWGQSKQMFIHTINFVLKAASKLIVFFVGLSPIIIPLVFVAGVVFIWRRKKKKTSSE